MLELYLTRHGETQWNTIRRMQGQEDSQLTDLGRLQAEWLGKRLEDKVIVTIYSSPLGRAKETTAIINAYTNSRVIFDDRLKEINAGPWQGKLIEEIEREMPKENEKFWHDPVNFELEGVEAFSEVQRRAGEFIDELVGKHGEGKILIVAHAIVLKAMLNYVQGRSIEHFWEGKHIFPTSLTKLNIINDRISVGYMSDTSHYEQEMKKGWFIDK